MAEQVASTTSCGLFNIYSDFRFDPVILEHMGDIYHQLGIYGKALIHYKKALEQGSNNILIQDKINKLHDK